MLLGTLRASLLEIILADKGAIAKNHGQGINRAGEGIVRAGYGENKKKVKLIFNTANSLTNFEGKTLTDFTNLFSPYFFITR